MSDHELVSLEAAEAEFQKFVDAHFIDDDVDSMDDQDKAAFKKQKGRFIKAVQRGALEVDDATGHVTFTPFVSTDTTPIVFKERTGADLMAQDNHKSGKDVAKSYSVMAAMTGEVPKRFANLKGIDIKICEAIFALLMD